MKNDIFKSLYNIVRKLEVDNKKLQNQIDVQMLKDKSNH
jgi:hypothetical protein